MALFVTISFGLAGCTGTDPTVTGGGFDVGEDVSTDGADSTDSGDDASVDPCEDVDCGGHGTCFERSGAEPECVCDSGYRPEGLDCVELDPDAPCDGVTCSGNGACVVENDAPRCECEEGFESGGELTCVAIDPCEGENCSGHGTCVVSSGIARCQCDDRYESGGLACTPEDADGDGEDFTVDCDDNDADINSSATEVCDGVDNNCDGQIDEGEVCGIWVLEPRSSQWDAYAMDPAASGNAPTSTIRAAWDIESLDIAFVLTDAGYHILRISSLSWQSQKPLSDLGPDLGEATGPGTSAVSVPNDHAGGDGNNESVTLSSMSGSDKLVWQFEYNTNTQTHVAITDGLYGDSHTWDDPLAPTPSEIRASWLDVDNSRGWMDADPSDYCDTQTTTANPYSGRITSTQFYMTELGSCFVFTHEMALGQAPISQPANPPPFDEVGAAFWHQGALYMFRGN
ncbi:MAG: putative metal-binding motif-containing protein [Myxococcota bacterium]